MQYLSVSNYGTRYYFKEFKVGSVRFLAELWRGVVSESYIVGRKMIRIKTVAK